MNEILTSAYPFWVRIPVQWGQTNVYEQVPQDLILQWVESGRVPLLEALDLMNFSGKQPGIILGKTKLQVRHPFRHPDQVAVGTRVGEIGRDRFVLETAIWSERKNQISAHNHATMVLYDYAAPGKMAIPAALLTKLQALQAGNS